MGILYQEPNGSPVLAPPLLQFKAILSEAALKSKLYNPESEPMKYDHEGLNL